MKFNNDWTAKIPPEIDNFDRYNDNDKELLTTLWYTQYHANEWLTAIQAGESNPNMTKEMTATLNEYNTELNKINLSAASKKPKIAIKSQ